MQISDRAGTILARVVAEAARRDESLVEPEAVLHGILREGEGVACLALRRLGVEPTAIAVPSAPSLAKPAIRSSAIPVGNDRLPPGLLITAGEEATALGHRYIGTKHLLLALAGPRYPRIAAVLADQGITLPAARRVIGELLGRQL